MKTINLRNVIISILLFLSTLSLRAQEFPDNLDIIILVDVSGSMEFALDGTYPAPVADERRLDYVTHGLDALVRVFTRLSDPIFPSGGGGVNNRRFAIGRFPGNAPDLFTWLEQNNDPPPDGNSNLRDYNDYNGDIELPAIISTLSIRWAGTPIGTAIIDAIQMFDDNGDTPSTATGSVIFLFTDGKRYNGESIYEPGYSSGDGVNRVRATEIRDYIDHPDIVADTEDKIKIVSLGFGDEVSSETDFDMLDDISVVSAGRFDPNAESGEDFTKRIIYNSFSGMGYGAALSDPSFLLSPGDVQENIYPVTNNDQRLLFMVSWSEPKVDSTIEFTMRDALGQLIDPAAASQDTNIVYDAGKTFQMYTIGLPYFQNNLGMWTLIVNGENLVKSENYSYSILGHSTLQLKDASNPLQRAKFTGDKMQLQVSLTGDGNPILDAVVTAQVSGPNIGAGNWFAEYVLTPSQLDSVRSIPFPGFVEDVYKKYYYMNHINNIDLPGTNAFEIVLTYDQRDSLYKGESTPLSRPGIYDLMVTATNDSAKNANPFKRDLSLNYHIKVRPNLDWTISSLEFDRISDQSGDNDIYKLKFTPLDKFRNFVKPGKKDNIKFHVRNSNVSNEPIVDDLQGSYFKNISVPSNSLKPIVRIQFGNFVFDEQPITDNPKADNWRFYLNAISLHFGSAIPTGSFENLYNSGMHASIDYYRQISKYWAINVFAGYSSFKGKSGNTNQDYFNISTNVRWYPAVLTSFRFFLNSGGGYYLADKNTDSGPGINVGTGINIPISSRIDLEIGVDYHNIIIDPDNITFIRPYGGILIRF